jgi:hypothetical protein
MLISRLSAVIVAAVSLSTLAACQTGTRAEGVAETANADCSRDTTGCAGQDLITDPSEDPAYPARYALAQELFELSRPPDFYDQLRESLILSTLTSYVANYGSLSSDEQASAEEIVRQQFIEKQDEIVGRIASVYADLFLKEELEDLVRFHGTDTGAKFRAVAAEVNKAASRAVEETTKEMEAIVVSAVRPQQQGDGASAVLPPTSPNEMIDPGTTGTQQ